MKMSKAERRRKQREYQKQWYAKNKARKMVAVAAPGTNGHTKPDSFTERVIELIRNGERYERLKLAIQAEEQ